MPASHMLTMKLTLKLPMPCHFQMYRTFLITPTLHTPLWFWWINTKISENADPIWEFLYILEIARQGLKCLHVIVINSGVGGICECLWMLALKAVSSRPEMILIGKNVKWKCWHGENCDAVTHNGIFSNLFIIKSSSLASQECEKTRYCSTREVFQKCLECWLVIISFSGIPANEMK